MNINAKKAQDKLSQELSAAKLGSRTSDTREERSKT